MDVELGPFTVLIGQNGAGKSSFLQAMQVLSWLVRYRSINDALAAHGLNYNELVYLKAPRLTMQWEAQLELRHPADCTQSIRAHVEISLAKRKYVLVSSELIHPPGVSLAQAWDERSFGVGRQQRRMVAFEGTSVFAYENVSLPHSVLLDAHARKAEFPVLSAIAAQLSDFLHYEIWGPELLRSPSKGSATILAEKGGNLPSVLHMLRSRAPDRFAAMVRELKVAYSWLDSIEIRRLGEGWFALGFLEAVQDKRKRRVRYEPSQVSDGFLRLLALTALKYQVGAVSILGYEEPENGLHPGMLMESVKRLRDIAHTGTQVIITTHSPFLLQYLLSEEAGGDPTRELRLVWRRRDGRTVIRPPSSEVLEKARRQGIGVGDLVAGWVSFGRC